MDTLELCKVPERKHASLLLWIPWDFIIVVKSQPLALESSLKANVDEANHHEDLYYDPIFLLSGRQADLFLRMWCDVQRKMLVVHARSALALLPSFLSKQHLRALQAVSQLQCSFLYCMFQGLGVSWARAQISGVCMGIASSHDLTWDQESHIIAL